MDTSVIIQNPPVQIEIQVTDSISCYNNTDGELKALVHTGMAPFIYEWNTGSHAETISGVKRGSYSITVTDVDQCTGTQTIVLNDPDELTALVDVNTPTCFNFADGSVTLGATGGTPDYAYFWNDTLVNGTLVDQKRAGTYMLRIIDKRNCILDTPVMIREPEPLKLSIDESNTVSPFCPDWQNGALAIRVTGGTPIFQFEWTDYPDETDSILNDIREDKYEVRVTDIRGCTADGIFKLTARSSSCLGIPTAFTPNYDFANDTWEINYINEDGGEATFHDIYPEGVIEVYDRLGSLVYRCTGGCAEPWNGEDLKGRALPVDTYYFIIELNNGKDQPPIKGIVTIIK
jgi:gliding motility-associated-like protein